MDWGMRRDEYVEKQMKVNQEKKVKQLTLSPNVHFLFHNSGKETTITQK